MNAVPVAHFDLGEAIPASTLAIEASAGAGKTFALANLATRCLGELDVPVSELLVVTFTRAATSELRSRIRQRIVEANAFLGSGSPPPTEDQLLVHLRDAGAPELARRSDRLGRAAAEFDTATITTIHGFASQMLGIMGVNAGIDPDAVLVDDAGALTQEVCADVLAAAAVAHPSTSDLPTLERLVEVSRTQLNMPDLVLWPTTDPDADRAAAVLVELATRCVETVRDRRQRRGTLSFDDVLVRLRDALRGPEEVAARAAVAGRFRVALIDEFQDTDPVQWDIFSTLFGRDMAGGQLVLVGDPKQAIYSFRGADVQTFAQAVTPRPGLANRVLSTNWRSDGAMVHALNVLFDGTTFGDDRIAYSPVEPAPENEPKRLVDEGGVAYPALSIRLALEADIGRGNRGALTTREAERAVFGDVADQLVDLLHHAWLPVNPGTGVSTRVPVRPSDIAVLVRTADEAAQALRSLRERGIPAVLARGSSVLGSPAATHWRWLLEAMLRPTDPRRARTFALSHFGGVCPEELATLSDEGLDAIHTQLRHWAETLQMLGVAEWARQVRSESEVLPRVLSTADGERTMTDLDHIAELFQAAAAQGHLSIAGLLAVLDTTPEGSARTDADDDPTARRVESDEAAVRIMTVWVAKGLEFPVVCCPTLWHPREGKRIYRDPRSGSRTYDVTKGSVDKRDPGAAERWERATHEQLGEELRLLYVALTRAKHHTLVWWSRTPKSAGTGLAHVLFARTADSAIDPVSYRQATVSLPKDDAAIDRLRPMVDRAAGTIAVSSHGLSKRTDRWVDRSAGLPAPALGLARLDRTLDRGRRRWSFTAMTRHFEADRHDPYDLSLADRGAADEQDPDWAFGDELGPVDGTATMASAETPGVTAETAAETAPEVLTTAAGATPETAAEVPTGTAAEVDPRSIPAPHQPLALLPAGVEFGTLVHRVLERVDFASSELAQALEGAIADELEWHPRDLDPDPGRTGVQSGDTGRHLLAAGLQHAIETPLGPLAGGNALRDVQAADRLTELSFELVLGESGRRGNLTDIGRLVVDHLETTDPLHPWAAELAGGALSVDLGGHLTGSIDVILRVGTDTPRFLVIDYKTNRLGRRGEEPRPDTYGQDALASAMAEHHYPLQALLYSVALHRYLRWRLVGYDPARHLGGAAYLFLRGMGGASAPVRNGLPDGVFSWAIPADLVTELSDLLDHGTTRRARP